MTPDNKRVDLSALSTIFLCATILTTVLIAGSESGSTINFRVTALFVSVATAAVFFEKRPIYFFPETLLLMIWLCYSLIPSMGADSIDLAVDRIKQMVQIVILAVLSINVMIWHGRTAIFALVYFTAAISAYFASLVGFGFGIIDESVLQELNSADRIVGTTPNANEFAMICLQAQIVAVFVGIHVNNAYAKLAIGLATVILGLSIIHTGSRTALLGMVFFVVGLVWVFRAWRLRYVLRSTIMVALLGCISIGTYFALDEESEIRTKWDSYLENEQVMGRYENLFRLVVNVGDLESVDGSQESSVNDRADLIGIAWQAAVEVPLGLGLDNFRLRSGLYAHSNYFELLATTGFIGLALYVAIYFFALRRALLCRPKTGPTMAIFRLFAMGIVVIMITDVANVSYYSKPFWLFISLTIASLELYRRADSIEPVADRKSRAVFQSMH